METPPPPFEAPSINAADAKKPDYEDDASSHYQLQLVHSHEDEEDIEDEDADRHEETILQDNGNEIFDDGILRPSNMRARYVLKWFQNHPAGLPLGGGRNRQDKREVPTDYGNYWPFSR